MVAIVIAYYQFEEGQRREEQSVYQTISARLERAFAFVRR